MKKLFSLFSILLIIGCNQKNPINIDLLRPSKDHSIYYSKETNQPYTGPVIFTDENDNIFFQGSLNNGEKKGEWIYWDENGDRIDGLASKTVPYNFTGILFYNFLHLNDEILISYYTYEKGVLQGNFQEYYNEIEFKGDKRVGTYVNGIKEGPTTYFFAYGAILEQIFVNDIFEGPATFIFPNGDRNETNYVNGMREGPATYFYSPEGEHSGNREERIYVNDIKEGPATLFYADGRIRKFTYVNGIKEGTYTYVNSKGDSIVSTYVNGILEGPAKSFYTNGAIEEFAYVNGVKEGPSTYFASPKGEFRGHREERTYVNGILEGPATYIFDTGDRQKANYVNGIRESE